MNKYDLIMFDMDGTLMDSKQFHYEVFYRFLNEFVMQVTREQVEKGLGATVREIFDSVGVREEKLEGLFSGWMSFAAVRKWQSLHGKYRRRKGAVRHSGV